MLKKSYPYYLANRPVAANTDLEVLDKYSGKRATRVAFADAATMRKAIVAAHKARSAMAAFPRPEGSTSSRMWNGSIGPSNASRTTRSRVVNRFRGSSPR